MTEPALRSVLGQPACGARVLIVGGSTRAAAWSAVRAGLQPICADLFADLDTRQVAEIVPVRDFPYSLPEDVARVQADGWFYTGGLENHPDIIERMLRPDAPYGSLWGTPPAALRLVRDPFWLAETLRAAGLPALEVLPESSPPPADGTWLQKPLASAGGRAIRVWDQAAALRDFEEPHYFQRRVAGDSCSAVFRARDGQGNCLGATQQLNNLEASRASVPFAYCGSIGPIDQPGSSVSLTSESRNTVTRIAKTLAGASGLYGLFGIDFVLDGDRVWVTELNPRYTASMEVLELARRPSLLAVPAESGFKRPLDSPTQADTWAKGPVEFVAKAILYARHSFAALDLTHLMHGESSWHPPHVADVSAPGTVIAAGWPICTVFATGHSPHECFRTLKTRCNSVRTMCGESVGLATT